MSEGTETLADKVIQLTHDWSHLIGSVAGKAKFNKVMHPEMIKLRKSMESANRFKLDDDFVREAVRKSSVGPVSVLRIIEFANLPFDKVWIEFDQNVRVDAQAAQGSSPPRSDDLGTGGFLIERTDDGIPDAWTAAWFMAGGYGYDTAFIGQAGYAFGRNRDALSDAAQIDEWTDSWPLAWGYKKEAPHVRPEEWMGWARLNIMGGAVPYTRVHKRLLEAGEIDSKRQYENARAAAAEGRGDLRFLVTVLAMINLVPITYVYKPGAGRYTKRLRNIDYLSHRTVTIEAGKMRIQRIVDRAMSASAMKKKRHKVRGFYRVYHRGLNNQKIAWVEPHERGDASIGYCVHSYQVTT